MKPKFTPGPWMPYSDGTKAWVTSETKFVAEMSSDTDRCDADARLIAASPEMYEALETAINCLMLNDMLPKAQLTADLINKALAKARGES